MRIAYCVVVCLLSSALAIGQNSGRTSPSTPDTIRGIKIFSSNFDWNTQTVQLDFMNDSPSDITAWGFCVSAVKSADTDPDQGYCTFPDALPAVVERDVYEKTTLKPLPGGSPDGYFIHPGEHKILSAHFYWGPVKTAQIDINLVMYANGTAETTDEQGVSELQMTVHSRQTRVRLTQMVANVGQKILNDTTDQHPAHRMIDELEKLAQTEPGVTAYFFKRPEWRKANRTEFIPKDERGYLARYVLEERMYAAGLAKYVSQVGQ